MHKTLIVLALVAVSAAPAVAQVTQRDRIGTRFDNDIRSNNEAMSRRFSGPNHQIDDQNIRLRERLNATNSGGLRRLRESR